MLRVLLYWNFVSRVYKTNMVYITNTGVTTNIRKIFASLSHDNSEQVTIFQCYVSGPTQLILPAPKGVKFLKMNNYKDIFKDIMNQYPDMSYSDSPSNLPDEQLQDIVTTPDTLPTPEAVKEMTDLYGSDYDFIVLSISKPGQCAPVAYIHPSREDKRLFLPTRVRNQPKGEEIKWNNVILTINTTHSGGQSSPETRLNTAFRWDLIEGIRFPQIECIRRILTNEESSNHNVYMATTATDNDAIPFVGPDGTLF